MKKKPSSAINLFDPSFNSADIDIEKISISSDGKIEEKKKKGKSKKIQSKTVIDFNDPKVQVQVLFFKATKTQQTKEKK